MWSRNVELGFYLKLGENIDLGNVSMCGSGTETYVELAFYMNLSKFRPTFFKFHIPLSYQFLPTFFFFRRLAVVL